MQFDESTNNSGICQQVWFLTKTDSTSLPKSDIARITNSVIRELALLAWSLSGHWNFDDKNHTTLNIATTSLVNSQGSYELPSTVFDIERAEVIGTDGVSHKLIPLKEKEIDISLDEFQKTDGIPNYYYLRGNSIFLKPEPDTSQVSTLKIYLSRDISEFTPTDTTKEPGFPSALHPIIPLKVAFEVAGSLGLPQINYIKSKIDVWDNIFTDYYVLRGKEFRSGISIKTTDFE